MYKVAQGMVRQQVLQSRKIAKSVFNSNMNHHKAEEWYSFYAMFCACTTSKINI
jgi:hypothetical protein